MRLREILLEKNMRMDELAALLDIPTVTLYTYGAGTRRPPRAVADRIAAALGVSVMDLWVDLDAGEGE